MAHFTRIYSDSFYANGKPLPATWWETLDTNLSKSLNGDAGGTYNPSSPIIVGGAGFVCGAPWEFTGGAQLKTLPASGQRILHDDNDYITLPGTSATDRTIVTPCGRFCDASEVDAAFEFINVNASAATVLIGTLVPANVNAAVAYRVLIPLRIHNGATFQQAVFWFAVQNAHSGVPANLPQFRVYKVDANGVVTPLRTASTLPNGFEPFPTPASGTAWVDGNAAQSFAYTPDAGIVFDDSTYQYFAEIIDESGTNATNGITYTSVVVHCDLMPDMRPQ